MRYDRGACLGALLGAALMAACSDSTPPAPGSATNDAGAAAATPTPPARVPLSFAVFEADRMWPLLAGGPLSTTDINAVAGITNDTSTHPKEARKLRLKVVAPLLHARRSLFEKDPLSAAEIAEARRLADVVADASGDETLRMAANDEASARVALDRVSVWFAAAQLDDQTMPYLLPTLDDGPFYGVPASRTTPEDADETSRVTLPRDAGTVVVWKPRNKRGVFSIELLARDGGTFKRWDLKKPDSLIDLVLHPEDVRDFPGYGSIVVASSDWSGGREAGFFHFTEQGDLRFFFLSW